MNLKFFCAALLCAMAQLVSSSIWAEEAQLLLRPKAYQHQMIRFNVLSKLSLLSAVPCSTNGRGRLKNLIDWWH